MNNYPYDNTTEPDMPTTFEELEVRRALTRMKTDTDPDANVEWEKFRRGLQIPDSEDDSKTEWERPPHDHRVIWAFLAGAAAAVIALFIVFPFTQPSSSLEVFTANQKKQQIVISSDEGDMTIVKDQQPVAFDQKTSTTSLLPHKVKMMDISTPRGMDYQLTLPDGSKVWLNADSKISFPDKFVGKERNVRVEGEAYFEVTKDAQHPFIVSTDYFTTTVHGTSFNVNAYSAKTAGVTLVSGSVSIKTDKGNERLMTPGQMASYDGVGDMNIRDVDVYPITQWKEGFFYFNDNRLIDIMMELGRWYNVSIVFEHEADMNRHLHFVAGHKESLREIIKRINDLGIVKVNMQKDHISIE